MAIHRLGWHVVSAMLVCFAIPVMSWAMQSDEIKERITGRWEASAEKTKAYLKDHEDAQALPPEFLDNLPKIIFAFTASGETNMSMEGPDGESRDLKGKWKVLEEKDADHATLHVVMMVDENEDAKTVNVEFVDKDTMAFSIENEPTLVFGRAKEKADADKSDAKPKQDETKKKDGQ